MLDTRTERVMISHDEGIILSPRSWEHVEDFLNFLGKHAMIKQLFVVLTTPLIYAHSNRIDKLMDVTNYNLLDDARDHWPAIIHR